MKLFVQYNRINIAFMTGIFLLASAAYYVTLNKVLIDEVDESLEITQDKIEQHVKALQVLPDSLMERSDDLLVQYQLIAPGGYHKKKNETVLLYNKEEEKADRYRQLIFCTRSGGQVYEIRIARPLEGTRHLFLNIVVITVLTIFGIALSAVLITRVILRKLWAPFYQSLERLKTFRIGTQQTVVFPATRTDEFNAMNEVMQDAVNKAAQDYLLLREFTDNASHEMQTPLAIIRSRLDLLSQEVDLSESQSEILHSAYSAINRLARLNKALLLLTKIENRQFDQVVTVNLEEKLQDKVSQFRELWESNQISFSARLQKATIQMDTALCDILLNNLLSNAGNHNFPGGSIEVVLQEKSLSITNTSKAEAADQQLLFTRFYKGRADSAHNGLGLSIVKQICDLSGITITYRHTAGFHYFELSWS